VLREHSEKETPPGGGVLSIKLWRRDPKKRDNEFDLYKIRNAARFRNGILQSRRKSLCGASLNRMLPLVHERW